MEHSLEHSRIYIKAVDNSIPFRRIHNGESALDSTKGSGTRKPSSAFLHSSSPEICTELMLSDNNIKRKQIVSFQIFHSTSGRVMADWWPGSPNSRPAYSRSSSVDRKLIQRYRDSMVHANTGNKFTQPASDVNCVQPRVDYSTTRPHSSYNLPFEQTALPKTRTLRGLDSPSPGPNLADGYGKDKETRTERKCLPAPTIEAAGQHVAAAAKCPVGTCCTGACATEDHRCDRPAKASRLFVLSFQQTPAPLACAPPDIITALIPIMHAVRP